MKNTLTKDDKKRLAIFAVMSHACDQIEDLQQHVADFNHQAIKALVLPSHLKLKENLRVLYKMVDDKKIWTDIEYMGITNPIQATLKEYEEFMTSAWPVYNGPHNPAHLYPIFHWYDLLPYEGAEIARDTYRDRKQPMQRSTLKYILDKNNQENQYGEPSTWLPTYHVRPSKADNREGSAFWGDYYMDLRINSAYVPDELAELGKPHHVHNASIKIDHELYLEYQQKGTAVFEAKANLQEQVTQCYQDLVENFASIRTVKKMIEVYPELEIPLMALVSDTGQGVVQVPVRPLVDILNKHIMQLAYTPQED